MKRYKVVLVGESDVGKTSLVYRYQKGESYKHATSTIGMAFSTKRVWVDEEQVILEIWDSAGQERFRSIVPMYFKGSQAVIMVYDLTFSRSAESLKNFWKEQIKCYFPKKLPVIAIIGNKIDLVSQENQNEIIKEMKTLESMFGPKVTTYFTSAKTGENVQQVFEDITEQMYSQNTDRLRKSTIYLGEDLISTDQEQEQDQDEEISQNCCYV